MKEKFNLIQALTYLKEGKAVKQIAEDYYLKMCGDGFAKVFSLEGKEFKIWNLGNINLKSNDFELYEEPKPILDAEEKAYLEAVFRPFKDRVVRINKSSMGDYEYLRINVKSAVYNCVDTFRLPFFKAKSMYKNMEFLKDYTLKELGLFERKIY